MTPRDLARRLAPVAGDAARIEARWLVEAAAGDSDRLEALIRRRLAGEPVDRVTGRRGFWTLDLAVRPNVLSPRSDTETVVRAALAHALGTWGRDAHLRLLDLGAGSGAILLALLAELPEARGLGVDASPDALAAARANAAATGLAGRAAFQEGDWAAGLAGPFDLVVSNPPYIPSAAIAGLDREVRDHDPGLALDGGADGLDAYRAILPALPGLLAADGAAVLEFGAGQAAAVAALAERSGLRIGAVAKDLGGHERAITLSRMQDLTVKRS